MDEKNSGVRAILDKALTDAQTQIPSEEITYTEMMENLAHSNSSQDEAAIKVSTQALVEAFPFGPSCRDDDCTCAGYEKWQCAFATTPDEIARIIVMAIRHPRSG